MLHLYIDSGGIKIFPTKQIIWWQFPKSFQSDHKEAYATIAPAPDEIQIAMHGDWKSGNRDICLYSRGNITLGTRMESGNANPTFKIQFREQFNYGLPSHFEKFPLVINSDRWGFGKGLARFVHLHPGYPHYSSPRDSIIMLEMQFDTIFGYSGGNGYAKFIRGRYLDTTKFEIDRTGSYKIKNGTEIRPNVVDTDTGNFRNIVITNGDIANNIYVDQPASFRIAHYVLGITPEYGCLLTLSGDDDGFVILKGFCKDDSVIIRGNSGYTGFIEYLLYKKATGRSKFPAHKKYVGRSYQFIVIPSITNQFVNLQFRLLYTDYINLRLYDTTGRLVRIINEGFLDAGPHFYNLDISSLSQGVYFINLKVGSESRSEKIVVVK